MLATYLTVTLGMLLITGVTVGALVQGLSLREQKTVIMREMSVVSELFKNSENAIVSRDTVNTELTLIARHYDAYFEWIPYSGEVRRFSSGQKWQPYAGADYNELQRAEIISEALDLEEGNTLFEQERGDFPFLIGTQAYLENGVVTGVIRFYTDVSSLKTTLDMVYLEVMLVCLIAILISVIAVYYTTSRMTRPFMEISEIVQRYSKGDFNVRIPISSTEEATQLAVSFNAMADQLKDLEATRRSFVANVSHELRSPLTSMKGFLEAM
ncbi:MAG: HAMP domain-containing protein, partial [Clostridia bacterium]|nr:HAMP domain-containing protein [Clostridia bacterium]